MKIPNHESILFSPIIVLILTQTLISCIHHENNPAPAIIELNVSSDNQKNEEPLRLYGIPCDSLNIITGTIKPNRFLSDILSPYGVTGKEIDILVKNSKDIFDVRKIRARNNYTILTDNDSAATLRYFIYDHEPGLSYIFSFNDSLNITPWRLEYSKEIKFSSFTIETSLWDAMKKTNVNPELSIALSEIFAWTVDFFGLQKGDKFKVIYEEKYIGDKYVLPGRIYGASFISGSREYKAIPFIQNGIESYYDTDGSSLRREFLKAPLKFSRITSRFSAARMHPILRIVRPHHGVDYAAPVGTPVYTVGDGKITETGNNPGAGKYVKIRHNSVYSTAYLHLSSFGKGIVPGAYVKQGDIIGYVGSSGLSTGPHLDFRFYKNGYPVDPLKVEAPPSEPVLKENLEKFNRIKTVISILLDQID